MYLEFHKNSFQLLIISKACLSSRFYRVQAGNFTYRHYHVNLVPVFEISILIG